MFDFLKNKSKKIDTTNIRNYNEAIKTINFFIATLEWEKAEKAINEISNKELSSYKELIGKIEESGDNIKINKEKEKINKVYSKKQKTLSKLKEKLFILKKKYFEKREKERFDIRFKTIKEEINHLAKSGRTSQSLKLLSNFLEENPGKSIVIKFYNKEKKIILNQIEKQKIKDEQKLKQNAKLEALKLIGKKVNIIPDNKESFKEESFFKKILEKINFYKKIKKKLEKKKLLDEVTLLIEEDDKVKKELAGTKLENMHKGLIKEISRDSLLGYDLYGKILGAHKISGDTFGFNEVKKKYTFFIGDATGHGIKAGFIITLLTRFFNQFVEKKSLKDLIYEINNGLKQDLKSMNFITGIFFEIFKDNLNKLNFVGLGHEPILIYRAETKKIERRIPGGLAAGIRLIRNSDDVKVKNIEMKDGDIILIYSDGIVEAKSLEGEFYGMLRLEKTFEKIVQYEKNLTKIYDYITKDAKSFRGGANFDDDLTIMLLKRNIEKDEIKDKIDVLEEMGEKEKLSSSEISKLKGKTRIELKEELEELKKEKQMKNIIKQLEQLWLTGEILRLKQEATRFIKDGFIHPKINYYLKKAIENQQQYKISLKEDRLKNKYNVMKELVKKGDYSTVIKEAENIIAKDGNI